MAQGVAQTPLKIGILNDQSGVYADFGGTGSVERSAGEEAVTEIEQHGHRAFARQAAEDWRTFLAHRATELCPGGRLFIREGHPVLWSLDDPREDGLVAIEYPYYETVEGIAWDDPGTYAAAAEGSPATITSSRTQEWNHGLGEILTAVMRHGLQVTAFEEHDCVPYRALGDQMEPHPDHPGEYRLTDRPERLPATYTLQATKVGATG